MSYARPFAGLKVVDLSQGIAGPYCAMLLAQYGADVIKVEPPEGDWARTLSKRLGDHTAFSIAGNLGKRSIVLDLKHEAGRQVLWRLIDGADVFIEGFRPGVMERLGFAYPAVAAANSAILYLSVSGFGQTGPLAERPALDPVLQAFTGMLAENKGFDGIPHRSNVIPIDMGTGLYAYQALATALYARRDAGGTGRHIQASLLETGANLQVVRMLGSYLENWTLPPGRAPAGTFRTADGWIMAIILHDREFQPFCDAMELGALKDDPRFATNAGRLQHAALVNDTVTATFATRATAEWCERLTRARILHEKVNDYRDFLDHRQVSETGLIAWLDQPGAPDPVPVPNIPGTLPLVSGTARATAPSLGQDSEAILREHGYGEADIAELAALKVVGGRISARKAS
ncbi:MAG: CoA transferase [Alphaproteobacteria bacterium]|nr:CoA transferase [Alphaproteobacteria bacterium]